MPLILGIVGRGGGGSPTNYQQIVRILAVGEGIGVNGRRALRACKRISVVITMRSVIMRKCGYAGQTLQFAVISRVKVGLYSYRARAGRVGMFDVPSVTAITLQ